MGEKWKSKQYVQLANHVDDDDDEEEDFYHDHKQLPSQQG